MVHSALKGLIPKAKPPTKYWVTRITTSSTSTTITTVSSTTMTLPTAPAWVMFKKIPKMCKGNSGIITF